MQLVDLFRARNATSHDQLLHGCSPQLAHGVERNALHQTFGVDVRVERLSIVKGNSPPARMRVMDLVLLADSPL
jgi:hypothetical protein